MTSRRLFAFLAWLTCVVPAFAVIARPGVTDDAAAEWRWYSGDNGAKRYSPLAQITKESGRPRHRPGSKMKVESPRPDQFHFWSIDGARHEASEQAHRRDGAGRSGRGRGGAQSGHREG